MKKLGIVLIIAVLLFIFLNKYRNLTLIESYIKDSITFAGNLISKPFAYFKENIDDINNKKDLYKKYEKLEKKYNELLLEYNKYDAVKKELESLKNNISITDSIIDYNIIHAYVINRNIDYFHDFITINKGSNEKIKKGMLVINNKGLIGVILNTTSHTSTVSLITNCKKKVAVSVDSLIGFLSSSKNGYLIAEVENKNINNNVVYTADMIKGIKIGEVKKEKISKFELSKTLYIKPYVDFNDIDYVMVLDRKVK